MYTYLLIGGCGHTIICVYGNSHEIVQDISDSWKWQLEIKQENCSMWQASDMESVCLTDHCLFVGQDLGHQSSQSHALLKPDMTIG